ncbi:ribosome silencing factor [Humitalea sp. 24SJ18S-53]|uniref:ribosome silencing factor n=1 Tax=Humitalea sp. 24SJ18S-53 TaxID=3422307 RepID=UPI003D66545B
MAAKPAKPAPKAAAPKAAKTVAAKPKGAATKKVDPTAGPVTTPARRAKRQKVPAPLLERLVLAAVESLESDKAENVVVLDIATRSSFADRMIIATGLADRQINAMATHVCDALEDLGVRRIRTEASPDWVLLDAGDIVLHLFKPEARATYALERMWGPDSPPGGDAGPAPAPIAAESDDEA